MRALIAAALLFAFPTAHVSAQEYEPDPRALCTAEEGVWVYESRIAPEGVHSVPRPEGVFTQAWECRVSGHTLTVRSAADAHDPQSECGACDLSAATIWVDRRQVSSGEIGELDSRGGVERGWLLRNVGISRYGVSVCFDEVAYEGDLLDSRCDTYGFADIARLPRDPAFVPAHQREPFAWEVWPQSDVQCAALTADLTLPAAIRAANGEDPDSLRALRLDISWRPVDEWHRTARFDLDNDGREDDVAVALDMTAHGEPLREIWTWAGSRRVPQIDRARDGDTGLTSDDDYYVAYRYLPVRWRGRTLLYIRRVSDEISEEGLSAYFTRVRQPQDLSRGLIELSPDGGARLVCAWSLRSRPEDRM